MNPKLASINSSDTIRMISTIFGCMLKGYFSVSIMYGLPSPHKSESSSAYDKKEDARTDVVANYL